MEDKLRRVAENHFDTQDCAKNCVEVNILRAKLNNAFMITSILLGSLLSLNGVIFLQVYNMDKTISSRITNVEATEVGIKQRLDQHRLELTTIEGWHLGGKDKR